MAHLIQSNMDMSAKSKCIKHNTMCEYNQVNQGICILNEQLVSYICLLYLPNMNQL